MMSGTDATPVLNLENRARDLEISLYVMAGISFCFLALRFVCKSRYNKKFALDDYLLAISWVFVAAYTVIAVFATKDGLGRHVASLSSSENIKAHRLIGIASFFNVAAIAISKTSFAVTLLRLALETWQKWLIWGTIVTTNLFLWTTAVFIFTSCTPFERIWDRTIEGACWNRRMLINYNIFSGAWSAAMDFFLAMFPWYLIWHLSMRRVEKLGVCVAMSLGVLSGATAVLKTVYVEGSAQWRDWSYLSVDLFIWAGAEATTVIVAASIPFLRPALKELTKISGNKGGRGRVYQLPHIPSGSGINSGQWRKPAVDNVLSKTRVGDDRSDKCILFRTEVAVCEEPRPGLDLEQQMWTR